MKRLLVGFSPALVSVIVLAAPAAAVNVCDAAAVPRADRIRWRSWSSSLRRSRRSRSNSSRERRRRRMHPLLGGDGGIEGRRSNGRTYRPE